VSSEDLMQNTGRVIGDARDKIVQPVLDSCLKKSEKVQITKTIKGSLYYLDLWEDEDYEYVNFTKDVLLIAVC
jgi:hypothetical protein